MLRDINAISADSTMGRGPDTPGIARARGYIINQFKEMGVKPGMPGNSYIQDVPVVGQKTNKSAELTFQKNGKTLATLHYAADFMAMPAGKRETVDIQKAPLIYVGYGIEAPEQNWDDFKNTDVKGKIIVVKNDDPSSDPELFAGKTRLYYGRWGYKYEMAAKKGALGVLIIHTTPTAGYPWSVVSNSWSSEQFMLPGSIDTTSPTQFDGWLTHERSTELFNAVGLDLDVMLNAAENRDFQPVPLKGITLSLKLDAQYRKLEMKNIVATLPGSDPDLKDQYVVFTAHYDHLGVGTPVQGDSIYNGAVDNASGVSTVLNLARAYSHSDNSFRRSLIFLIVTGEEKGLLGSQYYANNPTVPPGKISADINFDSMNPYGPTRDLVYIGYGRSSIDSVIDAEAQMAGRVIKPDQFPTEGHFYRSDQFSFAKIGVPVLYVSSGTNYIGKPEGFGEKIWKNYTDNLYHTVRDEVYPNWDLTGMANDVNLIYKVGLDIANADQMMTWKPGDEFEAARKQATKDDI